MLETTEHRYNTARGFRRRNIVQAILSLALVGKITACEFNNTSLRNFSVAIPAQNTLAATIGEDLVGISFLERNDISQDSDALAQRDYELSVSVAKSVLKVKNELYDDDENFIKISVFRSTDNQGDLEKFIYQKIANLQLSDNSPEEFGLQNPNRTFAYTLVTMNLTITDDPQEKVFVASLKEELPKDHHVISFGSGEDLDDTTISFVVVAPSH